VQITPKHNQGAGILLTTAAFIIIVAGMREAQDLLVPFLLSTFIAIIAAPALTFLTSHRIPIAIAMIMVMLCIAGVGMLLGSMIGSAVDDFSTQLPLYQDKLKTITDNVLHWITAQGIALPEQALSKILDPSKAMNMAASGLTGLGGLLTNTLLILLTVVFILLEAAGFPAKLHAILKDPEHSYSHFDRFVENIKRYMAIKTITSMLTGVAIYIWLVVLDVDYPELWGVIAFFLNYVPNIGSIIAAVPAVLLALIQLGPGAALWTGAGFIVVNNIVGNIIEPRFMGKGLGLSSLVVFLSLIFWGWILGSVGMFLSVPLTMTIKIALDSREDTRWIAILLGPEIEGDEQGESYWKSRQKWRLPFSNPDKK